MADHNAEKWIYLSYEISPDTPVYGNGASLSIKPGNQIRNGDSCNTAVWNFPNHLGTHIDFPRHFYENGASFSSFPPECFIVNKVDFINISPVEDGEIITPDHIDSCHINPDVEMLLIKTGFCEYRERDIYWRQNPGIDPDAAAYLRTRFLKLRMIGFDSISLSSYANRILGRKAHKAFLGSDRPILPIEDMDLRQLSSNVVIQQMIVAPLPVKKSDGAPCTILAKVTL